MVRKEFTAWAIDTNSDEGHSFIGRYWKSKSNVQWPYIPTHLEGCKTALFKTRALARIALEDFKDNRIWQPFPKARVVKVKVVIEAVK